jgi:hypothetical protein
VREFDVNEWAVYEYIDEKILSSTQPKAFLGSAVRAMDGAMSGLKRFSNNVPSKLRDKF